MCIPGAIFEYEENEEMENQMMNKEGLVYIGDILDYGDGWVDMETAEMLLAENC
tara:strand:+ start:349 stop:510 length:162 start_codon:yes stop_codon:yes gene_type:complete